MRPSNHPPKRRGGLRAGLGLGLAVVILGAPGCAPSDGAPPKALEWAYPKGPPEALPEVAGEGPFRLPGSLKVMTKAEVQSDDRPADWFPGDHPPAPAAVAGPRRKGGPQPCAGCHLFNGSGFIAAADLSGLPAAYIEDQVRAFRSGSRRSAEANRPDVAEMIAVAKAARASEASQAARYFSTLRPRRRVRLVETDSVPVTRPSHWGWLEVAPGGRREAIGGRIVEVSEDFGRMVLGDDRVGLIDYAPRGSVAAGERLAAQGAPGGQPCRTCHGSDLRGLGPAPRLAGRPASYLARALWDLKTGARRDPASAPMAAQVGRLDPETILDLCAYLASRPV